MNKDEAKKLVLASALKLVETGLIARTWGNVSCRIDEHTFSITASGRSYQTMTTNEIVEVNLSDGSYQGDIKPSSEKCLHAAIYKYNPKVNFIIHTHQENASAISASGLTSIKLRVGEDFAEKTFLGDALSGYAFVDVACADYGLPGTKKMHKNILKALPASSIGAVIMRNHGVICYGKSDEETFSIAQWLEKACSEYVISEYLKQSNMDYFNAFELVEFALSKSDNHHQTNRLSYEDAQKFDKTNPNATILPVRASLQEAIHCYTSSHIFLKRITTPEVLALAQMGATLKPLLDDFAQLIGTKITTTRFDPRQIANALLHCPAVMIPGYGAICSGSSEDDAIAACIVTQKNSKAFITASIIGKPMHIPYLEQLLMHQVYKHKYSRQIHKQQNEILNTSKGDCHE